MRSICRRPRRPGPSGRCGRRAALARCLALALLVAAPFQAAAGADFVWSESDWSAGQWSEGTGIDPDIHPGALVLENRMDDFRYLTAPTSWQGLWSMTVYHDSLFIAASDYPYVYDGADVVAYDYLTNTFAVVYQPYESGLHLIKAIGDTIYVPGPDSRDPWETAGSIYTYDGHEWVEKATVPRAAHVNDVVVAHGRLYATSGQATGELNGMGCVWVSDDWGDTFTPAFLLEPTIADPYRRFFGLGSFGGRLFAQPDGYAPQANRIFSTLDGVDWDTLTVNGLPADKQAVFVDWSEDSLLMAVDYRLYIWNGVQWRARNMPFNLTRWGRGIHKYKGELYGGGLGATLYRWLGDSAWEPVTTLPVNPDSTHIATMATYYGRVFLSTWGPAPGVPGSGKLYVSAALPAGTLRSRPHDFGTATAHGVLSWDDFRPAPGHLAAFQIRSAATLAQLEAEPFLGPDGTADTFFEESGASLPICHLGSRYFQYLVELRCPGGLWMPLLRSVTLEIDSLDPAAVDPTEGGEPPRGASEQPPRLDFRAPQPNPARTGAHFDMRLPVAWAAQRSAGATAVHLKITDLTGRRVRSVTVPCDAHGAAHWIWDLRDDHGHAVVAGVYQAAARLSGGGWPVASRALVVLP